MAARQGTVGGNNGPADFYWGLPPVTRTHVTAAVLGTLFCRLGVLSPRLLALDWSSILRLEVIAAGSRLQILMKVLRKLAAWLPASLPPSTSSNLPLWRLGADAGLDCAALAPRLQLCIPGALLLGLGYGNHLDVSQALSSLLLQQNFHLHCLLQGSALPARTLSADGAQL